MEDKNNIAQQIKAGLIEEKFNEQGIPHYVLHTDGDLETVASRIKAYLEKEQLVAHDFDTKLWKEDLSESVNIDYRSGWPIDGIANGEVE